MGLKLGPVKESCAWETDLLFPHLTVNIEKRAGVVCICYSLLVKRLCLEQLEAGREWWGLPGGSDCKEFACNAEGLGLIPGLGRFWRREWLPTPVFLPGESHGQWSLEGYSPWGHEDAVRRYSSFKVRSSGCTLLEQP